MTFPRRRLTIVLAPIAVAIGCSSPTANRGSVSWDDAADDVARIANLPDLPLPDLTHVTVHSGNGELLMRFQTNASLAPVFAYTAPDGKKRGATLGSLYLDIDNDASTGGSPFSRSSSGLAARKGYERQVSIQLGYLYTDAAGGSGMSSGDVALKTDEVQITGATANYYVYALSDEPQKRQKTVDFESIGLAKPFHDLTSLGDDFVEVRVPYAALGVTPGDTVRLCFHDAQQSSAPDEESVSEDLTLQVQ